LPCRSLEHFQNEWKSSVSPGQLRHSLELPDPESSPRSTAYITMLWSIWSMVREGSVHPASPMTLAGTPATVTLFGTGLMTTEPAAMRAQWPISMLPRILAPAPIMTPLPILG